MPKTALVVAADGTEEIECCALVDILRRGGVEVTVASVMKETLMTFANGMKITADCLIGEVSKKQFDAIVYPGGLPGAAHLAECKVLADMTVAQKKAGGLCAAICASPALCFEPIGLLDGEEATCYPSMESHFKKGKFAAGKKVVVSHNVITSMGPWTTGDFALAILEYLESKAKADEVAKGILFHL